MFIKSKFIISFYNLDLGHISMKVLLSRHCLLGFRHSILNFIYFIELEAAILEEENGLSTDDSDNGIPTMYVMNVMQCLFNCWLIHFLLEF